MATVSRFVSRAERISRQKADEARQAVLDLQLPETATETMLWAIARYERGKGITKWTYNMIGPQQALAVWDAIRVLPGKERPHQVRHLFDLILTHLEPDTGLVTLTRHELSERTGASLPNVSRMLGTLERMGVITREWCRIEGKPGRGERRYRINPHVGWNGELVVREVQARQMPLPLSVIDGGRE